MAATAWADTYWNVWQGNLPDSGGVRSKYTPFGGGSTEAWLLRLSWTADTHDMHFLWIANNGDWSAEGAELYGNEWSSGTYYDRWVSYSNSQTPSGVAQAGCQNPIPLATVYTNCRNAASLS